MPPRANELLLIAFKYSIYLKEWLILDETSTEQWHKFDFGA